ncbi:MAG: stage V sporulation protein AC [Ruminococcaceae bacterium]|nr:stage V sporulation protein AC [Oscillospiraceae bacterium]
MDKEHYKRFADAHAPASPLGRNCLRAFWVGGLICVLGQVIRWGGERLLGLTEETAGTLASVTLIFFAALLSGLGIFDRVAKYAGAGTLVPITGFANSVVSPAIDCRAEGLILGVGAKIFTVAGPVLLYGTLAGTVYGLIYLVVGLFL